MGVRDQVRLVIYRVNKKGLEIFLIGEGENWECPKGSGLFNNLNPDDERIIELETADGQVEHVLAVEGDWHDIPSIRAMIKEDVRIVKKQIKQHIPDLEKGTYFAAKEAVKKVIPNEYAYLKELKDIILDRNQVKYI